MMNSINERRSIRKYQEREVDRALITELIQAARMAPSAKNRQPWKYLAYTGNAKAELVDYLDTEDQLVGAISVGYPAEHPPARPRKQIEDILEFRR